MKTLLTYDPSHLLTTSEGYLQTKRDRYLESVTNVKEQLAELHHKAFTLTEFGTYMSRKFKAVDRELAMIDNRWKVITKDTPSKKTNKETKILNELEW